MSTVDEQAEVQADLMLDDVQPEPEPVPVDGQVVVFVAEDRMSAEILVTPPMDGGAAITEEGVLNKLEEAGVKYGVDADVVARAVASAMGPSNPDDPPARVVVARGTLPTTGEDATVEYHQTLTEAGGRPRMRPDGGVDLLDLNLVRNVTKDTVLATLTPAGSGEPGWKVNGVEIPAFKGRDVHVVAGKGTRFSDDKLTVTATVDGYPALVHGEITVTDLYRVKEDVGVATGNIDFVGSVTIGGSVNRGFKVKAEGNVEIMGTLDGGIVEAAGNVVVRLGIAPGSRVIAGGSIRARFIESAEVCAGKDVWAEDGILQSRLEAGETVEVMGRRGAIIGGHVMARASVSARTIGSPMGAITEITVGLAPGHREALLENQKKKVALEQEFQKVDQAIERILEQNRRGVPSQHGQMMLSKLARVQEELFSSLEAVKARGAQIERDAPDPRSAWVQAKETCHPGVTVFIGKGRWRVTDPITHSRFRLTEDLEIATVPI